MPYKLLGFNEKPLYCWSNQPPDQRYNDSMMDWLLHSPAWGSPRVDGCRAGCCAPSDSAWRRESPVRAAA